MFKKMSLFILTAVIATTYSSAEQNNNAKTSNEKYEILSIDQVEPTSTLAIPFDDSEVEDRQAINRDEKREVFPLPPSR